MYIYIYIFPDANARVVLLYSTAIGPVTLRGQSASKLLCDGNLGGAGSRRARGGAATRPTGLAHTTVGWTRQLGCSGSRDGQVAGLARQQG